MNRIVLVLVLVLAPRAHAEPSDEPRNLFGFRIGLGMLPLDDQKLATYSVGLGVEHPAFGRWRVFGDYEWLWVERTHTDTMPGIHGDGQLATLGVRHAIAATTVLHDLRLYADAELGGSFALVDDDARGLHALPAGLAGVRVGYDLPGARRSESKLLEFEVVVRAIAIPGGVGVAGGVGALWK